MYYLNFSYKPFWISDTQGCCNSQRSDSPVPGDGISSPGWLGQSCGDINPLEWQGVWDSVSGTVLCDIIVSGEVLCDIRASGTVLCDIRVSGTVLCDIRVSGTVLCDIRVSGTVLCDISPPGWLGHAIHITMTFCLNCSLGLFHKCLWKRKIQKNFSILCFRSNIYWLTNAFESLFF